MGVKIDLTRQKIIKAKKKEKHHKKPKELNTNKTKNKS